MAHDDGPAELTGAAAPNIARIYDDLLAGRTTAPYKSGSDHGMTARHWQAAGRPHRSPDARRPGTGARAGEPAWACQAADVGGRG